MCDLCRYESLIRQAATNALGVTPEPYIEFNTRIEWTSRLLSKTPGALTHFSKLDVKRLQLFAGPNGRALYKVTQIRRRSRVRSSTE